MICYGFWILIWIGDWRVICYGFWILILVGFCYGFCSAEVGGVIEKLDSGGGGCGWLTK